MRRDVSLGYWPVPATLLAVAAIAWWSMQPLPQPETGANTEPSIEARGARSIIVRDGGHKAWEFSADRITIAPDHVIASIENIGKGVIFQAGAPLWRLRAKRVEANQLTRDVQAQDAIASLVPQDLRIVAPRALWKHSEKTLLCPEAAQATMKNISVRAQTASYNTKSGELRCTRGVAVTSPFGTLSAPAATAYPKSRRVEFQGGVDIIMHRAALLSQRPQAKALPVPVRRQ
jgi:LPS export ABC transporter protein LptC